MHFDKVVVERFSYKWEATGDHFPFSSLAIIDTRCRVGDFFILAVRENRRCDESFLRFRETVLKLFSNGKNAWQWIHVGNIDTLEEEILWKTLRGASALKWKKGGNDTNTNTKGEKKRRKGRRKIGEKHIAFDKVLNNFNASFFT